MTIRDLAIELQPGIREIPIGQSRTCTINNPLTMEGLLGLSLILEELGTQVDFSYRGNQYTFTRPPSTKGT